MARRPLLLMLTAGAAAIGAVANGMDAAASPEASAVAQPASRLGASIAQDIQQRNAAAAQRSRALQLREQMVKATENRIQASLKAKQQQETAAAAPQPQAQPTPAAPSEMDSLATIYGAMKPAKAAAVFEQLDLDVQVMVAKRMRDRSTAAILAAMSPAGAAKLSMAMAGRRPAAPRPVLVRPAASHDQALASRR
jgi:flagellar motility protein MotE (MotC chaperone)